MKPRKMTRAMPILALLAVGCELDYARVIVSTGQGGTNALGGEAMAGSSGGIGGVGGGHGGASSLPGGAGASGGGAGAPGCRRVIERCTPPAAPAFRDDFEVATQTQSNWGSNYYTLEPGAGTTTGSMKVNTASAMVTHSIAADSLRGAHVLLAAQVKGDSISSKPVSYNGVKVMLHIAGASGDGYPQLTFPTGTYDWTSDKLLISIPDDATTLTFYVGLDGVSGTAWFDYVSLQVVSCSPRVDIDPACPIELLHEAPVLRGTMVNPGVLSDPTANGTLASWGANVVRFPLDGARLGDANYATFLEQSLVRLDNSLPLMQQNHMKVLVDLHGLSEGLFDSAANQAAFIEVWRQIARRYRSSTSIWAYDLANEPTNEAVWSPGLLLRHELLEQAALAIREIDPNRPIVVESDVGDASTFSGMYPIAVPRVAYSFHFYKPWCYTSQHIEAACPDTLTYPGTVDGKYYDRQGLAALMDPVARFQQRFRVPIFVGEFSVARWAPGAYDYLHDVIDTFESHGWDWTYHVYQAFQPWSVECGATPYVPSEATACPARPPTDQRKELLISYFSKNVRP